MHGMESFLLLRLGDRAIKVRYHQMLVTGISDDASSISMQPISPIFVEGPSV